MGVTSFLTLTSLALGLRVGPIGYQAKLNAKPDQDRRSSLVINRLTTSFAKTGAQRPEAIVHTPVLKVSDGGRP